MVWTSCVTELALDSEDNSDVIKMDLLEKGEKLCSKYSKGQSPNDWITDELTHQQRTFLVGQDFDRELNLSIEELSEQGDHQTIYNPDKKETVLIFESVFGIPQATVNAENCSLSKDVSYVGATIDATVYQGSCLQSSMRVFASHSPGEPFMMFFVDNDGDPLIDKGGKVDTTLVSYGSSSSVTPGFYRSQIEDNNNDRDHAIDLEAYDYTEFTLQNDAYVVTFKTDQVKHIVYQNIYNYNDEHRLVSSITSNLSVTSTFSIQPKDNSQVTDFNASDVLNQIMLFNGYSCIEY